MRFAAGFILLCFNCFLSFVFRFLLTISVCIEVTAHKNNKKKKKTKNPMHQTYRINAMIMTNSNCIENVIGNVHSEGKKQNKTKIQTITNLFEVAFLYHCHFRLIVISCHLLSLAKLSADQIDDIPYTAI